MARIIHDENLLRWEVFPSAGDHGFSTKPYVVFNCLTDQLQPPRQLKLDGDEADAENLVASASDRVLMDLFKRALPET